MQCIAICSSLRQVSAVKVVGSSFANCIVNLLTRNVSFKVRRECCILRYRNRARVICTAIVPRSKMITRSRSDCQYLLRTVFSRTYSHSTQGYIARRNVKFKRCILGNTSCKNRIPIAPFISVNSSARYCQSAGRTNAAESRRIERRRRCCQAFDRSQTAATPKRIFIDRSNIIRNGNRS